MEEVPPAMERTVYSGGEKGKQHVQDQGLDQNGAWEFIVHVDRLKPCMKTSALNDELPAPPKSHNIHVAPACPNSRKLLPDQTHPMTMRTCCSQMTKTEVRTMTHIPLTWVPAAEVPVPPVSQDYESPRKIVRLDINCMYSRTRRPRPARTPSPSTSGPPGQCILGYCIPL